MRSACQTHEYHEVAATLLFLASKLGNGAHFIKIEKIIYYCALDAKKDGKVDMDENGKVLEFNEEFRHWLTAILGLEEIVLEKLCFDDAPELPHPYVLDLVKDFKGNDLMLY